MTEALAYGFIFSWAFIIIILGIKYVNCLGAHWYEQMVFQFVSY